MVYCDCSKAGHHLDHFKSPLVGFSCSGQGIHPSVIENLPETVSGQSISNLSRKGKGRRGTTVPYV